MLPHKSFKHHNEPPSVQETTGSVKIVFMPATEHVTIILCRPEGSYNIGSVCRAMKASRLKHLVIIGNPADIDRGQVRTMALSAMDIFENARFDDSLARVLKDHVLSAGMTRRRGVRRKMISWLPEELVDKIGKIKTGQAALVFGNERNGLTDEELNLCDMAVHIPTDQGFPSLNLSHSVQIMGYLLYRASETRVGACTPINQEQLDQLIARISITLEHTGYYLKADPGDTTQFLKEILGRALLGKKESRRLEGLFNQLRYFNRKDRNE